MTIDTSQIAVPAIIGAIVTLIVPLILRQHWSRWVRLGTAILLTLIVAGAVLVAFLRPDCWQVIAAALATAVAVGQVVYQALKPTGIFDWISAVTDPATPTPASTTPASGAAPTVTTTTPVTATAPAV